MRFNILQVNDQNKLKKLGGFKKSFFAKKDDINIFHYYEVENEMFHVVFRINDEHLLGTKKRGNYLNVPFTQYINCFFFLKSKLIVIEQIEEAYVYDIAQFIEEKTGSIISAFKFEKKHFQKMVNFFDGFIKKIEYYDEHEDDYEIDFADITQFNEINANYNIDYISLNVETQFISLYKSGRISVDNTSEEYLIKLIKDVVNELDINSN